MGAAMSSSDLACSVSGCASESNQCHCIWCMVHGAWCMVRLQSLKEAASWSPGHLDTRRLTKLFMGLTHEFDAAVVLSVSHIRRLVLGYHTRTCARAHACAHACMNTTTQAHGTHQRTWPMHPSAFFVGCFCGACMNTRMINSMMGVHACNGVDTHPSPRTCCTQTQGGTRMLHTCMCTRATAAKQPPAPRGPAWGRMAHALPQVPEGHPRGGEGCPCWPVCVFWHGGQEACCMTQHHSFERQASPACHQ